MNEYTDLTTLNLDDCNVTYSPYVGKGYPVFIHRTRTIVARDAEDVLIVRFCVAMIPKLEELDRAIEREWSWVRDPLLSWPDGMAFGPDDGIYVTINQLHLAAPFNKGEDLSQPPYMLVRIMGGRPLPPKD